MGLFGGRGTGRSSWCCCRAWKSKPTPSHVSPPWLADWRNGSPLPLAPGLLLGSCSGNPFGGVLWGLKGLLGTSCPAPPQEGLMLGNVGAVIWLPHCKDIPPLKSSCNSRMFEPFLKIKVHPRNPGALAYPLQWGVAQRILPTSACRGALGYLLTWRGSRGQMQSNRAFHQVRQ